MQRLIVACFSVSPQPLKTFVWIDGQVISMFKYIHNNNIDQHDQVLAERYKEH